MKRTFVAVAAGLLLLTSCSSNAAPIDAVTSTEESPAPATPAIDPGPVALSKEQAATYYLDVVCQKNMQALAASATIVSQEPEFLSGGAPDPTQMKAISAEQVRLSRLQIEVLDDTYYSWPEDIAAQIPHLRSASMTELPTFERRMNSETFGEIYNSGFQELTPEQINAGQEIRLMLDLPADTKSSCAGHETSLDRIHKEQLERVKLLEEIKNS